MKGKSLYLGVLLFISGLIFAAYLLKSRSEEKLSTRTGEIKLPAPRYKGKLSVEEAIYRRRSIRRYKDAPLTLQEVSQLLWAGVGATIDGVTGATRAYPSAGATYPLELYLVAGKVKELEAGLYHYDWRNHKLILLKRGDLRRELTRAALGQRMVQDAPISLVFTAVYPRTTRRYGERGKTRYVHMDMGHAGQNIHLQAEALDLGTVVVGAFQDQAVKKVLGVKDQEPLYIMPVGRK